MMREGIDFLDGNYELVRKEKNARQIEAFKNGQYY